MYLMYVDESGDSRYTNDEPFILGAIILHEAHWDSVNGEVVRLKEKYFPGLDSNTIRFHARKIKKRKNIFSHLKMGHEIELLKDICTLIQSLDITSLVVCVNKGEMKKVYPNPQDPLLYAWSLLYERFDKFLEKKNKQSDSNRGLHRGVAFVEESGKIKEIERIIRQIRSRGTTHTTIDYVIEEPFFVPGEMRNLVQLADYVAHSYWCIKHPSSKSCDDVLRDCFNELRYSSFDRGPQGKIMGSGIKEVP